MTPARKSVLTSFFLFVLLTGLVASVRAEEPAWVLDKEEQARLLLREANVARKAAEEAGDDSDRAWVKGLEEAVVLLREIVVVAPTARRLYGLAFALFHIDQLESAHRACWQLQQDFSEDDRLYERCEALMAVLHDVVFRVELRSEPTGASVTVEGWPAGLSIVTPGQIWLREGRHTLHFYREGYLPKTQDVVVAAGYETKVLGELEKEPEPGSLELKVFPAGALVFIDGKPITLPMGGVVEVLEGEHVLSIAMEGFVPVEQRFTIAAHKLFRHRVELRERETGQDPYLKGFPGGEPVVAKRPTNPYKVGGWTAIGVGAASFVTGGVVHGLAFLDAQDAEGIPNLPGRRDEFERKRDDAKTKEITAYALYGVGAALVTTGLVLLLVDPNDSNDDSDDSDDTQVVPTAMGRGGAGLFVTGRF